MKWYQKHRETIVQTACLLFIILFTYAGLTKLLEGHLFYDSIRNSPILGGKAMASLASWALPLSELAVALLLIWKKTRLIGLYGAAVLMLLFTGYTLAIVFFAPYRPCSCGGVISLLSWEQHLVLNAILLLLALMAIWSSLKNKGIPWKKTPQGR
ncbi:MauE/DoxX family redox-associated membrane protein [Arenibacter palladensis]|uniref:MauE/DoxX family redox-associated membrane protein n=1 Tax=Arenibacter palladensis TaxID=237373 RepID=UPI0026E35971|nr:MauE/DoxX family redox-associated membrane protein [Arenibacter palladensis]MDO6602103.1 MauE/DoxX family redox-associated membrane protein [Arenibacter palladensis]